ncbi:MAG: hypothetical protein H8E31_03630, partial [Planctomycetes bacterium]|nr:hypothetical protein [Planctomycetota bacterium]
MLAEQLRLIILGATVTVGRQALQILERTDSPIQVVGLAAFRSGEELSRLSEGCPGCAVH